METEKKEILAIFEMLGVFEHQNIFIISDLLRLFSKKPIKSISKYIHCVLSLIDELTNDNVTIILPSFTYSFCHLRSFDIDTSRPETGSLPNAFLQSKNFRRTSCPITSHLISANNAPEILFHPTSTTFGASTVYKWIRDNDGIIINLGFPVSERNGWIIAHHIEEEMRVPYRCFKTFEGDIYKSGEHVMRCSQKHFIRKDQQINNDFTKLNQMLRKNGLLIDVSEEGVQASSVKASDVCDVAQFIIKNNPYDLSDSS